MSTVPSSYDPEADYAWEVATLFPEQGEWSLEEYLRLTDGTNRRIRAGNFAPLAVATRGIAAISRPLDWLTKDDPLDLLRVHRLLAACDL